MSTAESVTADIANGTLLGEMNEHVTLITKRPGGKQCHESQAASVPFVSSHTTSEALQIGAHGELEPQPVHGPIARSKEHFGGSPKL